MCHCDTVMQRRENQIDQASDGMICSVCGSFACSFCLNKIVSAISRKQRDEWCAHVERFLECGEYESNSFVGHCCELKMERKQDAKKKKRKYMDPNTPLCDGDLFMPEFGLMVKTSFTTVDIHALAPDKSTLRSGAWHATLPVDQAIQFKEKGLQPKRFSFENNVSTFRMSIPLPWTTCRKEYVSFFAELLNI